MSAFPVLGMNVLGNEVASMGKTILNSSKTP
jgi:hypothetical protein